MKRILPILFVLLSLQLSALPKEFFPIYSITSVERDSTLEAGRSLLVFRSLNLGAYDLSNPVQYSVNGILGSQQIGENRLFSISVASGKCSMQLYLPGMLEIFTDSLEIPERCRVNIDLNWELATREIMVEKPVIYLYPETEQRIEVQVEPKGKINFVYPAFDQENTWDVIADPEGNILFKGHNYRYLFWEAEQAIKSLGFDSRKGFWFTPENVLDQLGMICDQFGMTSEEKADLITYWGPQLIKYPNCFVHFVFNDEADRFAKLKITPKPDVVARFYMLVQPYGTGIPAVLTIPQIIPKMDRSGFNVLEWGGMIIGITN